MNESTAVEKNRAHVCGYSIEKGGIILSALKYNPLLSNFELTELLKNQPAHVRSSLRTLKPRVNGNTRRRKGEIELAVEGFIDFAQNKQYCKNKKKLRKIMRAANNVHAGVAVSPKLYRRAKRIMALAEEM